MRPGLGGVSGAAEDRTSARAATGTFTRKIARQPNASVSRPPSSGPATRPVPLSAAHTPIAFARDAGTG